MTVWENESELWQNNPCLQAAASVMEQLCVSQSGQSPHLCLYTLTMLPPYPALPFIFMMSCAACYAKLLVYPLIANGKSISFNYIPTVFSFFLFFVNSFSQFSTKWICRSYTERFKLPLHPVRRWQHFQIKRCPVELRFGSCVSKTWGTSRRQGCFFSCSLSLFRENDSNKQTQVGTFFLDNCNYFWNELQK